MITELSLVRTFLDKTSFDTNYRYVNRLFIRENMPEVERLFKVLCLLHQELKAEAYTVDDFEVFFFAQYPAMKQQDKSVYHSLFKTLREINLDNAVMDELLCIHRKNFLANEIAIKAIEVTEGKASFDDLPEMLKRIEKTQQDSPLSEVTDDLAELYQERRLEPGLRWRGTTMNAMLGSIRKGNLGMIFARTDVGKTTFVVNHVTYMAGQANGYILHFNNEEDGKDLRLRYYQSALGKTDKKLYQDIEGNRQRYREITKGNIKIFDGDKGAITKADIEMLCEKLKPALVVIDSLAKVSGFQADREDLRLGKAFQWARELAKQYCPVIAVLQANGEGQNKKWLTLTDVDNSKTAIQKECDWILGIGAQDQQGMENVRYLSLIKNKLPGDEDTSPELRKGKREVLIRPEVARYEEIARNGQLQDRKRVA